MTVWVLGGGPRKWSKCDIRHSEFRQKGCHAVPLRKTECGREEKWFRLSRRFRSESRGGADAGNIKEEGRFANSEKKCRTRFWALQIKRFRRNWEEMGEGFCGVNVGGILVLGGVLRTKGILMWGVRRKVPQAIGVGMGRESGCLGPSGLDHREQYLLKGGVNEEHKKGVR